MPRPAPSQPKEAPAFVLTPPRKRGKPPLPEPVSPTPGKPSEAYLEAQRR
ncbi:hypothetical protein [Thermus brockianus]